MWSPTIPQLLTSLLAATSLVEGRRQHNPFRVGRQITFKATTPGYTGFSLALNQNDNSIDIEQIFPSNSSAVHKTALWKVTAPLNSTAKTCVSFESVAAPNNYLRNYGFHLVANEPDGSDLFNADATYCPQTGFSGTGTWSLQSNDYPNRYFRHYQEVVYTACDGCDDLEFDTDALFANDASWKIVGKTRQSSSKRDLEDTFE